MPNTETTFYGSCKSSNPLAQLAIWWIPRSPDRFGYARSPARLVIHFDMQRPPLLQCVACLHVGARSAQVSTTALLHVSVRELSQRPKVRGRGKVLNAGEFVPGWAGLDWDWDWDEQGGVLPYWRGALWQSAVISLRRAMCDDIVEEGSIESLPRPRPSPAQATAFQLMSL